jgi:hypothetical protein
MLKRALRHTGVLKTFLNLLSICLPIFVTFIFYNLLCHPFFINSTSQGFIQKRGWLWYWFPFPTLNVVTLTNSPNNCMNVLNFNCGISDVHNLISVQINHHWKFSHLLFVVCRHLKLTICYYLLIFLYILDLNYDFLDEKKCAPLVSICDILDLTNLVKRPTCFTKIADPTLNDVILTNTLYLHRN